MRGRLGGLENVAQRNVKPDRTKFQPLPGATNEDKFLLNNSPGYALYTMLAVCLQRRPAVAQLVNGMRQISMSASQACSEGHSGHGEQITRI